MSNRHILSLDQLKETVCVHLNFTAQDWSQASQRLLLAQQWYAHIVGRGYDHLPLCLIFDLGLLLVEGHQLPLRSQYQYDNWSQSERVVHLRYETEFICRIALLPQMNELIELGRIGALPDQLIFRALELICKAIAPYYPQTFQVRLSHLREIDLPQLNLSAHELSIGDDQTSDAQSSWIHEHLNIQLTEFLDQLSHHFKWRELLSEADLFELRNWSKLHNEDLRIGCRQLLELSDRFGILSSADLILSPEDAERDVQFSDDTLYPTGGITELTTSGAWENLVLSELIYIDDEHPDEIDLFDVRFVENELLFYLRDEGQLSSKRRKIDFIIDLGSLFRQKSSGYAYQFSILIEGLIYSMIKDLGALFCDDALRFGVYVEARQLDPTPIRDELRLLQMLLIDEEQRDQVTFQVVQTLDMSQLSDTQRKRYLVVFTDESQSELWSERLQSLHEDEEITCLYISISKREQIGLFSLPTLPRRPTYSELMLPLSGVSIEAFAEIKRLLMAQLISAKLKHPLQIELEKVVI